MAFLYEGQDRSLIPHNVTEIEVASSVTVIEESTFKYLQNLKTISFPKNSSSKHNKLLLIRTEAFFGCDSLTSIDIPSTVKDIGDSTFGNCSKLVSIQFNQQGGLLTIGSHSFRNCISLKRIEIPTSVKEIGRRAFYGCESLISVEFPRQGGGGGGRIDVIPLSAFAYCTGLKYIAIPNTVREIRSFAFSNCTSLVSIDIPERLETVGEYAFSNCENLINIAIPNHRHRINSNDSNDNNNNNNNNNNMIGNEFNSCSKFLELQQFNHFQEQWQRNNAIVDALKDRFDDLPLHRLCYFHQSTNRSLENVMEEFHTIVARETVLLVDDDKRTTITKTSPVPVADTVDIFGMTPLHILVLSGKPNFDLFQEVWEICSKKVDLFHTKDVWGNSVIDCLCMNTCPNSINWMKCILRLAIVNRWKSLGLRRWRVDVRNKIDTFPNTNDVMARQQYVVSIFSILTKYEFLETLSLLELAIWKTKIEDDDDYYYSEEEPLRKRAKLDHHSTVDEISSVSSRKRRHRQYCRINCGAEIVITNILPYLG